MGRLIKLAIERPIAVMAMILMTIVFGAVSAANHSHPDESGY